MKNWKHILLLCFGAFLFLGGGYLAIQFYAFPVMPVIKMTIWRDVIMFSIVSVIGLAILIYTVIKIIRFMNKLSD